MFRGSAPAKIDESGRLKVPTDFKRAFQDRYGPEVFVTSVQGSSTLLYPLSVWSEIESRLASLPSTHRVKRRFLERISYFGQQGRLDAQGRIVIPQILREHASMVGDVIVFGSIDHLEVWNRELFESKLEGEPFTDDDFESLSESGI
jgi:MraZ protein